MLSTTHYDAFYKHFYLFSITMPAQKQDLVFFLSAFEYHEA